MGMNGADIAKLRDLSGKFKGDADTLATLVSSLQTACTESQSYWTGGKAESFRSEWESLKPKFETFVQTLRDAGEATKTNADNIDSVTN